MDERVAGDDSPERGVGNVECREVAHMELHIRERGPSLRDLTWRQVEAHRHYAESCQMIDDVTRPAAEVGDRAGALSRQLGERCEPALAVRVPNQIGEEELRVLFGHCVIGVPNLICRLAYWEWTFTSAPVFHVRNASQPAKRRASSAMASGRSTVTTRPVNFDNEISPTVSPSQVTS